MTYDLTTTYTDVFGVPVDTELKKALRPEDLIEALERVKQDIEEGDIVEVTIATARGKIMRFRQHVGH